MLKNADELLRQSVRQGELACRYGGEEFVLVLPGAPMTEAEVAERIREGIRSVEFVYSNQSLGRITASLGVAASRAAGEGPTQLIEAVDHMLYVSKNAGRDRVEVFGENGVFRNPNG